MHFSPFFFYFERLRTHLPAIQVTVRDDRNKSTCTSRGRPRYIKELRYKLLQLFNHLGLHNLSVIQHSDNSLLFMICLFLLRDERFYVLFTPPAVFCIPAAKFVMSHCTFNLLLVHPSPRTSSTISCVTEQNNELYIFRDSGSLGRKM